VPFPYNRKDVSFTTLVVEERETGDQRLTGLPGNVMADQLPESEHGEATVVDLIGFAGERRFLVHVNGKRSVVSGNGSGDSIIDSSNRKKSSCDEKIRLDELQGVFEFHRRAQY